MDEEAEQRIHQRIELLMQAMKTMQESVETLLQLAAIQVDAANALPTSIAAVNDQMRAVQQEMVLIKERLSGPPSPVQH